VERLKLVDCPLILTETGVERIFEGLPDMGFDLDSSRCSTAAFCSWNIDRRERHLGTASHRVMPDPSLFLTIAFVSGSGLPHNISLDRTGDSGRFRCRRCMIGLGEGKRC
jgi:hypothetical protein